jgi:hypothetical protein
VRRQRRVEFTISYSSARLNFRATSFGSFAPVDFEVTSPDFSAAPNINIASAQPSTAAAAANSSRDTAPAGLEHHRD